MSEKLIAVVVAMKREVAPLLRGHPSKSLGPLEIFEMDATVVAVGGVGRQAASRAANTLVKDYSPSLLVSAGIAGAVTGSGKVGDVIRAHQVIDADSGERFASSGDRGTVVTVSTVSGPGDKRKLVEQWGADVVEMEAAAVAKVAKTRDVGFLAIKAISDELDFIMPPLSRFVSDDGKFHLLDFAAFLAVHPRWWKAASALNSNSKVASMKLCEALRHLIDRGSQSENVGLSKVV